MTMWSTVGASAAGPACWTKQKLGRCRRRRTPGSKEMGRMGEVVIVCCMVRASVSNIAETATWAHAKSFVNTGHSDQRPQKNTNTLFVGQLTICGIDAGRRFPSWGRARVTMMTSRRAMNLEIPPPAA